MSKKLLKTIILTAIAFIAIYIPSCYAAGGTISTSVTSAKPGDTVELYVNLSTGSIGYDLAINVDNKNLISASEVVNKIGSGNASRIYLVQLAGEADRVTYPSGTKIATIKYTIAETATSGSKITLNVAGDVAGATSADKNKMDESVTIDIVAANVDGEGDGDEGQVPGQGDGTQGDGTQGDGTQGDGTQGDGTEGDGTQGDGTQGDGVQGDVTQEAGTQGNGAQAPGTPSDGKEEKDDTVAKENIPAAGLGGFATIITMTLIVIMVNSFKKYKKNKDIK